MLQVVAGGAGCDEMSQGDAAVSRGSQLSPSYASSRYSSAVLHANSSALHFKLIDSVDSSILDEYMLTK